MLMLIWPLVLDPRRKLDYFRAAGWEEEWIEAAREIVRKEFDRGYAGIHLETKMTRRNCYRCVIALLFQSYLIKAWKHSLPTSILPTFFMTYFHARALPLPTRN